MKSFLKIGKLKLAVLIAIVPVLAVGTVFAYNIATPAKTTNNATQAEQPTASNEADNQANDSEKIDETPGDQTASEPVTETSTQPTSQARTTTTTNPTQTATNTATNTAPQQTATNPTPTTPTCNQSVKSSYTSLYNSKVNAENASWNNQITAWNNYASSHGMAFSGYVQDQINQNKPAHDARLAQYQTEYYQNLASINCSP